MLLAPFSAIFTAMRMAHSPGPTRFAWLKCPAKHNAANDQDSRWARNTSGDHVHPSCQTLTRIEYYILRFVCTRRWLSTLQGVCLYTVCVYFLSVHGLCLLSVHSLFLLSVCTQSVFTFCLYMVCAYFLSVHRLCLLSVCTQSVFTFCLYKSVCTFCLLYIVCVYFLSAVHNLCVLSVCTLRLISDCAQPVFTLLRIN